MIKRLCEDYDIFMFDLDRTVFDTYSKSGEPIWAKQMIKPLVQIGNNIIKDDCESNCYLQPGVRSVLKYLYSKDKKVGFISRGGVYDVEYNEQPSVLLLRKFGVYKYFTYAKFMFYKTEVKAGHLSQFGKCVFFDDMDKDLEAAREIGGVKVIDRKKFNRWRELL
tara:strand:+ start:446 stop:940 length:495 start_codon:yes stop_codon:yes gene_type:complete